MEALALFAITMSIAMAQEAELRYRTAHAYPAPVVQEQAWQPAPVAYVPVATPASPVYAEPPARRTSGSGFIERWQSFMEPATGR